MATDNTQDRTDDEPEPNPATTRRNASSDEPNFEEMKERLRLAEEKASKFEAEKKKSDSNAASNRRKVEEYEEAKKRQEEESLGEVERLRIQIDTEKRARLESDSALASARKEALDVRINTQIEREAQKAGFEYPEDVPLLIDRSRVVIDDDGRIEVKSIKEVVDRLAKDRPKLVNSQRGGGTPNRDVSPRRNGDGNPNSARRAADPYVDEFAELGIQTSRM